MGTDLNSLLIMTRRINERVAELPPDTPERKAEYEKGLTSIIKEMAEIEKQGLALLSREKEQPVFTQNDTVLIRPVNHLDIDFYINIRMQYSMMYRAEIGTKSHRKESLFLFDLCRAESFFCIIEKRNTLIPVGYLGIKDTRLESWEIAIELERQFTDFGIGFQSIKLFLNKVSRITGQTSFRASIEADNVPSQRCFEKLGAELVGLRNDGLFRTPEEKAAFEEKNLALIDAHIIELAARLNVEPRRLLSSVLDYRIKYPI